MFTLSPLSFKSAFTLPWTSPATITSPIFNVPSWTRISAIGPILGSSLDSKTTPLALFLVFPFNSRISAVISIVSNSPSRFIFFFAETSTNSTSPPHSEDTIPCSISSCLTFIGFASGLSILFTATIIGTFATLAWDIASTVCGITPSSAATTSIAISVTCAPLALISVNASWPGVSIKVILFPSFTTW